MLGAPAGLALVLALVLALAGCGGSSKKSSNPPPPPASSTTTTTTTTMSTAAGAPLSLSAYRDRLRTINLEFVRSTRRVTIAARRVKSVSDLRSVLEEYASTQEHIANELTSLRPPPRAAKANALLARGFHDTAADIRAQFARLRSMKTPQQAFTFLQRLHPKGAQEIQQALAQLQQLGSGSG